MPRVGGVYSEPSGTKAVSGQTIQSVPYNTFIDDLVTDANAARPVTAGGTGATTASGARTNLGIANFVDADAVQTLTNKSLQDSTTYIIDNGDATKKVQFQVSGVATATTRTWTFPDADGTFVGLTNTQSLTNKTLDDSTTFLADNVDATKKLQFQLSGITTATTRTLTAPDISGTIIVDAGAQTISGLKTISLNTATTSTDYFRFSPTDTGTGKPYLSVNKSATATLWNISLWDGTNSAGTINFGSTTGLTWNGNQLADISTSQTFTNKTYSGGTISGTFGGSPTMTGNWVVQGSLTVQDATNGLIIRPSSGAAPIQLGRIDGTTTTCIIDFNTGATAIDYDTRLVASGGTGSLAGGTFNVQTGAFQWNGVAVVDLSSSQSLTNKTLTGGTITRPTISLQDSITTFQDDGDNTKQFKFQASGITTATTRTYTVPNFDATLATLAGTESFTNKTLDDATTFFADNGDATKKFQLQLSGITTATTRTWTVPDSSDTFVGLAATQTLTNKTLTSPTINGASIDTTTVGITQAGTDNSTKLATTSFVQGLVGPASFVKIASASATGSSVVFSSIPSSGYTHYVLIAEDVVTNAAATTDTCFFAVSTDNGSTFKTTSGDYWDLVSSGVSSDLLQILVLGNNSTFKHGFSRVELYGLGNSSRATMGYAPMYSAMTSTGGSSKGYNLSHKSRTVAEADNAFRLSAASSFNSGTFTLYGVKA